MRIAIIAAAGAAALSAGCTTSGDDGGWQGYSAYDYNRPDPRYNGYYADRYYRDHPSYRERRLARGDRLYRGRDGRYYCRRSDGTTGLIVGGVAGGILGNIIAPGGSETIGTIIGAAAGAAIGREVERGEVRCR
ncbi:glycine zipper 2TM domain-containing protein [Sphingosinicella sp. LHD-64]|uniref:glycine zipper 2TM domain-containing protein n=1 Tax=Sphingosinicella sp. LHD-64 TaxID=3072139 RepID=UPI00280E7D66|nr:glycine zipper 2TM domain-containing protein [Sphingosinicella sp. LHD-64]MDQ8758117.1 glycine zipper 2TM domain-containing protein [Sphingosinicella sp. LHD-64]